MKNAALLILITGGIAGLYFLYRSGERRRAEREIADLYEKEAKRNAIPFNRENFITVLHKLEPGNLRLMHIVVTAISNNDKATLNRVRAEFNLTMVPIIDNSIEWKPYAGIIR